MVSAFNPYESTGKQWFECEMLRNQWHFLVFKFVFMDREATQTNTYTHAHSRVAVLQSDRF